MGKIDDVQRYKMLEKCYELVYCMKATADNEDKCWQDSGRGEHLFMTERV